MRLVRRAGLTPQPWRNGGGVTWQIAAGPDGADVARFDWRISMAEVAAEGPFSAFAGIDRTLTLLQGAGLELDFGGAAVRLVPGDAPVSFPGDAAVTGRLSGGPVTDLNVMTRRGVLCHHVAQIGQGEALPPGCVALVALAAQPDPAGGSPLSPGDTLLADAAGGLDAITAAGPALAVVIRPARARHWISGAADG